MKKKRIFQKCVKEYGKKVRGQVNGYAETAGRPFTVSLSVLPAHECSVFPAI